MSATSLAQRLLILAPLGRDAELMCTHLRAAGIACESFADMTALCVAMRDGAGALLFTEEALANDGLHILATALDQQPAWSQIPVIILSAVLASESKLRSVHGLERRTNVTLIDRPVRIQSLVSAARAALAARQRQYDARDLLFKLEDRVHERDRFLAILGHELRNPLGAILLASQMTDESDGKLDGEHAKLIERQSRHLTRIVNDLLDLSRVMSGKIVLKPQLVDLRSVARQSLETVEASAQMHRVSIELKLPDEPVPVKVDPVRADQIVTNVLTNAIKYTPEGGHVVLALECEEQRARIRVKDDGVGIAADRIGTIFELFAQAENAIGRSQGGMGIGLALVRNLVELHGGSVTASSDGIGKGTEFIIELPCSTEQPAEAVTPALEPAATRPRKIVIVEDNVDVRDLLRLKLKRLGHTVDAVGDGVAGVEAIVDGRPHMALIDIGLPRLDGYQVATAVRSKLGRDVVLVAVSGFGQPEDKRKALEAGFDDHITKPADVQDIENLLARFPLRE